MHKKLLSILAALLFIVPGAKAQSDSINAYLLTCEPGKSIYELYGHTAIWIEDAGNGTDAVFNYGLFDFSTPHFIWRFSLGQTDYILGYTRLRSFLREYSERGSEVFAQPLNLTREESRRLYELLVENSRPENRTYRYNFLFNNCATMALDKIEECINGTVTYKQSDPELTFRDILTEHTQVRPWSEFAVDMVIGAKGDEPVGYRQEAFAPLRLKNMAESAVITDTAGIRRPLVLPYIRLVNPDHGVDFGTPLFTPIQTMWMVLLVVLFVTLIGWYKQRQFWMVDVILMGAQGLGGIIIALLFLFSVHPTVDSNWLVAFLNPLPLVFIPFFIRRSRRKKISVFMICEFAVCTAFLLIIPAIPQRIEPAMTVLIFTYALRAFSTLLFQFLSKYRKAPVIKVASTRFPLIMMAALSLSATLNAKPEKSPKLVVGIVVDQLDEECLEKLLPIMGSDGLKRLWTDGYNRTNATFDYDDMDRASAVASIHTGASPFQHGIVAGRWMNPKTLLPSSPLDDSNYKGINTIEMSSPARLLSTNLADEMKLGSGSRSKVCSIAIDRDAAILAGGHDPDMVLWMNTDDSRWSSSEYYGKMPEWVYAQNDTSWFLKDWRPALATSSYIPLSDHDRFRPFFYLLTKNDIWDYMTTPYANDRVTNMALASLDELELGDDDTPDLLTLTYYAGNFRHTPNTVWSLEQQDIYVRLDQTIAELINTITAKVGLDNVLFFLTSTGYLENSAPELGGTRIPTGQVSMERATALLSLYLSAKYGSGTWVRTFYHNHIYLNHDLIEDKGLALHEVLESSVDLLVQVTGIKSILVMRDLMSTVPDIEAVRKRNGLNAAWTGDIIIDAIPGWGISDEKDGTVLYRKPVAKPVPMILYGNGIRAEVNHEPISISVLAPTISLITRNDPPNACSAVPLKNLK
ncbi:MAG: DUF4105 domain-containing protein [Bacteroidaceae bacterium]|nr:DUF4105 domain-containing protein [Bacteroidaceae bacterium]